jgi:hypothetical protein
MQATQNKMENEGLKVVASVNLQEAIDALFRNLSWQGEAKESHS